MPLAPSGSDLRPLAQRLAAYGCTSVIRLDEKLSTAAQLDYLDLLPKQSNHAPVLTAVVEHQGIALLYLVDADGDVKSDEASLAAVRRQLANRSDPAWLGVVRPGSLQIFPIGFDEAPDAHPVKTIEELDSLSEIERHLRDVCGLSKSEATAMVSRIKSVIGRGDPGVRAAALAEFGAALKDCPAI